MTKSGAGTLTLNAVNAQTGTFSINEGTVALQGATTTLGATGIALTIRQGATLNLGGVTPANSIGAFNNNGTVTSTGAATLTVGSGTATGTSFGIVSGAVSISKIGSGNQSWLGQSSYTGTTTLSSSGLVTVDFLGNGGTNSGIGASTNAASNLVFAGSSAGLVYQGNRPVAGTSLLAAVSASSSTDRLFTLSGTGPLYPALQRTTMRLYGATLGRLFMALLVHRLLSSLAHRPVTILLILSLQTAVLVRTLRASARRGPGSGISVTRVTPTLGSRRSLTVSWP